VTRFRRVRTRAEIAEASSCRGAVSRAVPAIFMTNEGA
jgi:hypothetical protein